MSRRVVVGAVTALVIALALVMGRMRFTEPNAEELADRNPEVAAARALLRARNDSVQAWTLAQERARVLLAASVVRPSSADFALETIGRVHPRTRAAFAEAFEAELRALPTPLVPVRLVLFADSANARTSYGTWYRRPRNDGESCVIVMQIYGDAGQVFSPNREVQRLGVCGLYAIGGMPGPGIAAWLDSTRSRSALSYRALPASGPLPREIRWARMVLGWRMLADLPPIACASGRDEACAPALLEARSGWRRFPWIPATEAFDDRSLVRAYFFEQTDYPGNVAAHLRDALGDARFREWWASELAPAEAYERLTGEPFAAFAQRYLQPNLGSRRSGPLQAGLPLALGLLLGAGLAYWAIRRTPRARS